ncbi:MAG: beta-propeller domain-containing protein [Clostridia bacterium]|nr:beta-propeller domain-containing protein [Clostridia bacterium]
MRGLVRIFSTVLASAFLLTSAVGCVAAKAKPVGDLKSRLKDAVVLYVGSSQAYVNDTETQVDPKNGEVKPIVKDGRTLVPVRFISESTGWKVGWEAKASTVSISSGKKDVKLVIGSKNMTVNGKKVNLEVAAEVINQRAYIPLRQLVESLGKKVFYDRGLIVVSDTENIFDKDKDKAFLDSVISKVNNLPIVGSFDALKTLLGKADRGNGYWGKAYRVKNDEINVLFSEVADMTNRAAPQMAKEADVKSSVTNSKAEGAGSNDYSKTNVQVQGVDEADVVKTDGAYIYQVNKQRIVVAKAYPSENMQIVSTLKFTDGNFAPLEIYVDDKYMVVIGNSFNNEEKLSTGDIQSGASAQKKVKADIADSIYMMPPKGYTETTKAIIYDIADKSNIKQLREVELSGNYVSSRKIGNSLYLVANKHMGYYGIQNEKDVILPCYRDTAVKNEFIDVQYPEIRYFPNIVQTNYLMVTGINLENMAEAAKVSTYLGSGQNIYASGQNLYVAVTNYNSQLQPEAGDGKLSKKESVINYYEPNTLVYKFSLSNGQVTYLNKGEVPGTILNQFSMDENGAAFRIATTTNMGISKNNLYVLDEVMNITGRLEDIAPGEHIYSVRFMGDRAYMVTFKTVDPLFVIDLKDPKKPAILGALKIPGYSNYIHPYDENHIIGFGKDTVETDGRALNQGMKIALFDVTDVNNPKEMFKEIIGDRGTDSPLLTNHKALLFSKEKNLMAFPVTVMEIKNKEIMDEKEVMFASGEFVFQGAYVYNIDLEKGFTLKGKVSHLSILDYLKAGNYSFDYESAVDRILYIGDTLYTLSTKMIKANDLKDLKEKNAIAIP